MFCLRLAFYLPSLKKIVLRLLSRTHIWNNAERSEEMLALLKAVCQLESDQLAESLLDYRREANLGRVKLALI